MVTANTASAAAENPVLKPISQLGTTTLTKQEIRAKYREKARERRDRYRSVLAERKQAFLESSKNKNVRDRYRANLAQIRQKFSHDIKRLNVAMKIELLKQPVSPN